MKPACQIVATILVFLGVSTIGAMAGSDDCLGIEDMAETRANHLHQVNSIRLRQEKGALQSSESLDRIAQKYACLLAKTGHFEHVGPDGSTLSQRVAETGLDYCFVAENLAMGQQDLSEVLTGWLRSPGHRENLYRPEAVELGLGLAYPAPGPKGGIADRKARSLSDLFPDGRGTHEIALTRRYYWVQLFGRRCSK